MRRPRSSAGAGGPGAGITFGNGRSSPRIRPPAPAVQHLLRSPHLQRAFCRLHACGPQPCAMFLAELLDEHNVDPLVLDRILTWLRLDPVLIRSFAGDFAPPPLDVVPPPDERSPWDGTTEAEAPPR